MTRSHRKPALVLAAVLTLLLMATAYAQAPAAAEPLRFTAMVKNMGGDDDSSMVQQKWLELMAEKMGRPVEIKFERVPASEFDTKCILKLQTDDIADFQQLPSAYDRGQIAPEIMIDISQYEELIPNYLAIVDKVPNGRNKLYTADGRIDNFTQASSPRLPVDMGMSVFATFCYNWTVLEQNGLTIPSTTEELFQTATKLKELYPDSYPINTRWKGFWSVWFMHHCDNQIYWDGTQYVLGQVTENYRDALRFLNKLYANKLLDPEWSIETDDTYKSKMLNGKNFISLYDYYTDPGSYTRLKDDGTIFAVSLYPDTEKYGISYQHAANANTYTLGWDSFILSSKFKEPAALVQLCDLQYAPDVTELLNWGIEGVTFIRNADGTKSFVDSIRNAKNPYEEADLYGIQTSTKFRPGLQLSLDQTANVGMALNDWVFYDGQVHQEPIEQSKLIREIPFPNDDYIAPWSTDIKNPVIQLTTEDKQARSEILTPINTYRDEMMAKFIKGEKSLETDWDAYVSTIYSLGDVQKVLDMMTAAVENYFAAGK